MAKRELNYGSNKLCSCKVDGVFEHRVQNNLALTPRMVKEMTEKGIAVSLPNNTIDPQDDPVMSKAGKWELDPIEMRGFDKNSAWEMSKRSNNKITQAIRKNKRYE